jgi:hypothetical protein
MNDDTRGVKLLVIILFAPYYRTGTCLQEVISQAKVTGSRKTKGNDVN